MTTYTCFAIPNAPSWWPNKQPGATLDYSLDISAAVSRGEDFITFAAASVAPSGAGEMQVSGLSAFENVITLTCSGGIPTRVYTVMIIVRMCDGRTYDFLVYQGIPPGVRGYPVPVPPSPGFGPSISWPGLIGFIGIPIFGAPMPVRPPEYIVPPALFGGL